MRPFCFYSWLYCYYQLYLQVYPELFEGHSCAFGNTSQQVGLGAIVRVTMQLFVISMLLTTLAHNGVQP